MTFIWDPSRTSRGDEAYVEVTIRSSDELCAAIAWVKDHFEDQADRWTFFPTMGTGKVGRTFYFVFRRPEDRDLAMLFKLTWGG